LCVENIKDTEIVRIGLVQSVSSGDPSYNIAVAEEQIQQAAGQGANIVCLQELFRTFYFCNTEDHVHFRLAESVPGPTTARMQVLAADLGVVIIASMFEERAPGLYHNTVVVMTPMDLILGNTVKTIFPTIPVFMKSFTSLPAISAIVCLIPDMPASEC